MIETIMFVEKTFPWFFPVLSFVFGSIAGSFFNVYILRIPEGRSVVFPGSRCACGAAIPWYHNLPILSWVVLRGRAPCCGRRFSARYPVVELLTACLFLACWLTHAPLVAVLGMVFLGILIVATFIDIDHMIIPDRFSIGGMVAGVVLSILFPALHGVEAAPVVAQVRAGVLAVMGALIGAGLVYWIAILGEIVFRKPAMGEGDVKFVGFIGAFCGWQGAVFAMFGGAFLGSLVLLPVLLVGRLLKGREAPEPPVEVVPDAGAEEDGNPTAEGPVRFGAQVPFGPMLAAAGALYFLGFAHFVDAYFLEFGAYFFGG